jgi:hypothetical protein
MDKQIAKLLKKNRKIKHISNVKNPDRFSNWKEDKTVFQEYSKWIMHESGLPTLLMDIEVPHEEMLKEALAQKHLFTDHRGTTSPGWSSMAIHGTAIDHTQPREYYYKNSKKMPEYDWTELADVCPVSKAWIESLEFEKLHRVRFMKLEPGGWITPHQDTDVPGIHAWNVAINNPKGHHFIMDGYGLVPWKAGQIRGIDISKYHCVVNNGNEPRIHMIVHGHYGDKFKQTLCRSYDKLYEEFSRHSTS